VVAEGVLEVIMDVGVAGDNKRRGDIHYNNGDDNNYENARSSDVYDDSVRARDAQEVSVAAVG
jgi:hypothetical protein